MSSGSVPTGNVWTLSPHLYGKAWFNHRVELLHDGFTVADLLARFSFRSKREWADRLVSLHACETEVAWNAGRART